MRIRRARVESFGTMRDRSFAFSDGLNVVYGPNEAGKTTLKTFVTTSFYRMKHRKGIYPARSSTDRGEVDVEMSDGTGRTLGRRGSATEDLTEALGITDAEYTSVYSMEPEDLRMLDIVEEGRVRDRMLTIPGAADVPKASKDIETERKSYIGERWRSDGGIAKLMEDERAAGRRVEELRERENGDDSYNALVGRRSELEAELKTRKTAVDELSEADKAAGVEAERERTRVKIGALTERERALAPSERFTEEAERQLGELDAEIGQKRKAADEKEKALKKEAKSLGAAEAGPYLENSDEIRELEKKVPQYRADSDAVDRLRLSEKAGDEQKREYERLKAEAGEADAALNGWTAKRDAFRYSMCADPEKVLSDRERIEEAVRKREEDSAESPPDRAGETAPAKGGNVKLAALGAVLAVAGAAVATSGPTIAGIALIALGAIVAAVFLLKRPAGGSGGRAAAPTAPAAAGDGAERRLQILMADLGMRYTAYDAGIDAVAAALAGAERWKESCERTEEAERRKSAADARLEAFLIPYAGAAGFESAAAARPDYCAAKERIGALEARGRAVAESVGCPWISFPGTVGRMSSALNAALAWKGAGEAYDGAVKDLDEAAGRREMFLKGFGGEEAFAQGVKDRKELAAVRSQLEALRASVPEGPAEPIDAEKVRADLAAAKEAYDAAVSELARVRQAIADIEADGTVEDAITARSQAEAAVYDAVGRWATLAIEDALLSEACEAASARHRPEVMTRADSFLSEMTGGRYRISSDPHDRTVTVIAEDGSKKGSAEWSAGLRDQTALALKMSVALSLSGERPPMILDDVLLTSDSDRKAGGCRALAKLSESIQVIYFTCDRETRDLMVACGAGLIEV